MGIGMGLSRKMNCIGRGFRNLKSRKGIAACLGARNTHSRLHEKMWHFLMPEADAQPFYTVPDNPCIPYMRKVIEALLQRRGCDYRNFYPLILDFEEAEVRWGVEGVSRENVVDDSDTDDLDTSDTGALDTDTSDRGSFDWHAGNGLKDYEAEREVARLRQQVDEVLRQLVPGLNRMVIRTGRPAYFREFVQTMYEENGLVVQLEAKSNQPFPRNCFIIDFELWQEPMSRMLREDIFYLPIYRKPWEIMHNLDILVPIGYNTVIVKGVVCTHLENQDKFEREFYS